jgi:hypothetical protein
LFCNSLPFTSKSGGKSNRCLKKESIRNSPKKFYSGLRGTKAETACSTAADDLKWLASLYRHLSGQFLPKARIGLFKDEILGWNNR